MARFPSATATRPQPSAAGAPAINPSYSIGIPEMDAQHAVWIGLIDDFKSVATGELQERERVVVPANGGSAFAPIPHRERRRESLLTEIQQRSTAVLVDQVRDRIPLEHA